MNTITSRHLWLPENAALTHTRTITNMHHNVRTAFGDLTNIIEPSRSFGETGQGSRASPPACHSQLVVMINTLRQLTKGHQLQDTSRKIHLIQHVISWVDDTVNKESLPYNSTPQDKLKALQHTLVQ